MFPENIITACFESYKTTLTPYNASDNSSNIYDWQISGEYTKSTNVLGLVVFAIAIGVIIGRMKENEGKVLLDFFRALLDAILKITTIVIQLTPIAVLFIVLPQVLAVDNVSKMLASVGLFTVTTLAGLAIHGFIVYPILYFVFTRKNPYIFLAKMSAAVITALGTSSSSVTMPVQKQT